MAHKNYIVSVADPSPGRLAVTAQRLRDAGLIVTQVLDVVGVIVGHAEEAIVPRLLAVPGVAAIEEERDYSISSPESDI
jgi:hypothetical protein